MTPTCDLPQPPATPPSAIASMLHLLEPHYGRGAKTFTTIDFIGRFWMTAVEGHQRLNELADDGLVASMPGQAVESWQLTRDGAYVFSPDRKRVTKKFVSDVKACLQSIGPELLRQGAVELSIGGRPLAGKSNGQVLVGLRLKHEPFADVRDDLLLQQLCAALDASVGSGGYAPMLFSDRVPLRLRDRSVLVADEGAVSELAARGEQIDEDEVVQARWRARFCELHRLEDNFLYHRVRTNLPWGLLNAVELAQLAQDLPLRGSSSKWRLDDEAVLGVCESQAAAAEVSEYTWRSWSGKLFASLEYHASANSLPQFLEHAASDIRAEPDFYMLNPLYELARWEDGFESAAAQALAYYRALLAETRSASANRVKPKLAPAYLLYFDTLNFVPPRLVGFVRQPAGHNAHVNELLDLWNSVLKDAKGAPAGCLSSEKLHAGWLSLDVRDATPDEEAGFQELCKREGTSYRYLVFLPNGRMSCRKQARLALSPVELETPPVFRTATLGRAVRPRLLASEGFHGQSVLRDVLRSAPAELRKALDANIVFVDDVPMSRFAQQASLTHCTDPVVLSSQVLDAWAFSTGPAGSWAARAGCDEWTVVLEYRGGDLDLMVGYGTQKASYPLVRSNRTVEQDSQYDGVLGELIGFFSCGRALREHGLDGVRAQYAPTSTAGTDKQNLVWLSQALRRGLHGGGRSEWGWSGVYWPDFPDTSDQEEPEAMTPTTEAS